MKKTVLLFIVSALLLFSGCQKPDAPPAEPTNAQEETEKQPDYGNVFAHAKNGDFYARTADGKTYITYKTETESKAIASPEGSWRFSLLEPSQDYDYLLFNGYLEEEQGYTGSVYMFVKETESFAPIFDVPTSNAARLPTESEDYADLAWVLLQTEAAPLLCPVNLRNGDTETGQIISLAETDYAIEGEQVLVSLSTNAENPLVLRIENKTYAGSTVLSTTAYLYDFENKELTKITEEE